MTENAVIAKCLALALLNNGDLSAADFKRITDAVDNEEVDNLSPDAFRAWIGDIICDVYHEHALKILEMQNEKYGIS